MYSLEGCFDLHVHVGPDLFPRTDDDLEAAQRCAAAGLIGIAVKGHAESTASRAHNVNKVLTGFRYVGGVCLNYPVGGINPAAVNACLVQGGRVVWMPSGDSRYSIRVNGWSPDMAMYVPTGESGLTVLTDEGELTAATHEVVSLVKQHNALIATSHLSPRETIALLDLCQKEGVKAVLTHVYWTPESDRALAKAAVDRGAYVEISSTIPGRNSSRLTYPQVAELIQEIGYRKVVLVSDAGSPRTALSHEALRVLAENVIHAGIPEDQVRVMMGTTPLALIER